MAITEGESITLEVTYTFDGQKTDPSRPVVVQIKHLPSGDVEEYDMNQDGTGEFSYQYTPSKPGKYLWQTETADGFKEGSSFVVESDRIVP